MTQWNRTFQDLTEPVAVGIRDYILLGRELERSGGGRGSGGHRSEGVARSHPARVLGAPDGGDGDGGVRGRRPDVGAVDRHRPVRHHPRSHTHRAHRDRQGLDVHLARQLAAVRGDVSHRGAPRPRPAPDRRRRREHRRRRAAARPRPQDRVREPRGGAHVAVPGRRAHRHERRRFLAALPRRLPARRPGPARAVHLATRVRRGRTAALQDHAGAGRRRRARGLRDRRGRAHERGRSGDVGRQRHARHHRHRTPGAPARPVLRGGRAFPQDAGRRHQGRRAVADAGGGAEAAAHRRIDRPAVRPDRPPGAEPDGAVAVALAHARAASQRDGAPAAGRADRARRGLVLPARGPHRADRVALDPCRSRAAGAGHSEPDVRSQPPVAGRLAADAGGAGPRATGSRSASATAPSPGAIG